MVNGGWWMVDDGWLMMVDGWWMMDVAWWMIDSGAAPLSHPLPLPIGVDGTVAAMAEQ